MFFAKSLVLCASAVAVAVAQTNMRIGFTTLPNSVTAGQSITLKWAGGDNSPVTITLKQGDPGNLKTVALITGDAMNGSYDWTPSASLPDAENYALQITQDETDINYTGLFALTGGSASSGSSSSSATMPVSTGSSSNGTPAAAAGVVNNGSGASSSNSSMTSASNSTMTAAAAMGTGASGTGMSMPRNTTMSSATLTSSMSMSSMMSASSTSGEGVASSTSKAPSSTTSGGAANPTNIANSFNVVAAAMGLFVYLA